MPVGAIASIGGSLIGGLAQSRGASRASRSQTRAADQQVGLQREIYGETTQRFAPFLEAGRGGLGAYGYELGLNERPEGYRGFEETPGYQFQMDQGTEAVNALAGARGGLHSGRTMQDLQSFGQGLASQEYGNHLNRLAGMSDMGMGAAGNQAMAGNAYASGAGQAIGARGNAQAAGHVGRGNALVGGIENGIGAWNYQRAMAGAR